MSKSSGNNNNDINMVFIERLINAIGDLTIKIEEINRALFSGDFIDRAFSKHFSKYNQSQMTSSDFERAAKNFVKDIENFLKVNYNIGTTKREHAATDALVKGLSDSYSGSQINDKIADRMLTQIKNFFSSAVFESMKGAQKGKKNSDLYFTNTLDNEKLTASYKEFARRIGVSFDETSLKLMAFFQNLENKKEKKTAGFVNDLIEGLEKSKWVGGALRDTFRLIGLLGANWLSQFGQMGRILGGAFYVAMETAGPLLVNMLLKGMGSLFGKLFAGGVGWGLINKLPQNGPLGNAITTFYGGGTGAQKAAAAGRLAIAGVASAGLGAGALWAGGQAAQSFKQGDKVGGSAFGVGAAGLGIAAIAALVAGISAPITLIAAAVGGIAVGVGAIWKNREKITEHYKKNKDFYDKVLKFVDYTMPVFGLLRHFTMWYLDHFGSGTDVEDAYGNTNNFVQKIANVAGLQDKEAVQKIAGMGVNKAGGIIGLENVNRMKASEVAKEYFKSHPTQAGRMYEQVGGDYASLGDFISDWAIRDKKGNAIKAILHAGASEELKGLREFLKSKGGDASRVGLLKYTSGRKTGGDPAKNIKSSHKGKGLNSHENIAAMVTDLGAANWTDAEWETYLPWIQEYMKELGYRVRFEGNDSKGNMYLNEKFKGGLTNRHLHVDLLPGRENMAPLGVEENIAESKVRAKQETIAITEIAKQLEPDIYGDYEKAVKRNSGDEKAANMALRSLESEMRNAGYGFNEDKQMWIKKKVPWNSKEGAVFVDKPGNLYFERISAILGGLGATGASDGRIV